MGKLSRSGLFIHKPADNGSLLAALSKTEVASKLSKRFKEVVASFNAEDIRDRLLTPEELKTSEL